MGWQREKCYQRLKSIRLLQVKTLKHYYLTRANNFSIFGGFSLFAFLMNILCIGLVTQLVLCDEDNVVDCTSSTVPLAYAYVMFSLSAIVILAVTCLSGYLYFNAQLDYGEIIEQSLTKFKSEDEIRDALKSNDQAQKRAGKSILQWIFLSLSILF